MAKKRFILTVNPLGGAKKGLGLRILEEVKPVFDSAGVDLMIKETEYAGHARDIVNTIDLSEYDGFCPIGGDGTMHEVVNGLLKRKDNIKIPIGPIPAGTGNSFMHDLECLDPVEAARRIIAGNTRDIDAAHIDTATGEIWAFNIVGWGMVTDINFRAERYRWLGESRYTVTTVIQVLRLEKRRATLVIDGKEETDDWIFAIGCNTKHTGKGMKLAPHAKLDDGLIDLVVVRKGGRFKLLKMFPKVFDGSHVSDPIVEYHQVKEFSIYPIVHEGLNIDGELIGVTPIDVKMVPGAFTVFA
jgi:YegS/Rv2252/BmrU family lipid kinase